ncbi:unnamed protein product [Camellia sinensis]
MDLDSGFLSLENFKAALSSIQRRPKVECLKDCSVLELYILVCMRRLEVKEQESYNFNSVMKEYKSIHDSFQTSDYYARNAFEHLLECELISFTDNRGLIGNSSEINQSRRLKQLKGFIDGVTSPDRPLAPASNLSNLFGRLQDQR